MWLLFCESVESHRRVRPREIRARQLRASPRTTVMAPDAGYSQARRLSRAVRRWGCSLSGQRLSPPFERDGSGHWPRTMRGAALVHSIPLERSSCPLVFPTLIPAAPNNTERGPSRRNRRSHRQQHQRRDSRHRDNRDDGKDQHAPHSASAHEFAVEECRPRTHRQPRFRRERPRPAARSARRWESQRDHRPVHRTALRSRRSERTRPATSLRLSFNETQSPPRHYRCLSCDRR
ncbi:hypothetical protein ABH922_000768 [Rhodococcus sp. 27YEA15]